MRTLLFTKNCLTTKNDLQNSFRLFSLSRQRRLGFVFFFLLVVINSHSQCERGVPIYNEGEVISHLVYYNWGFIWVNAGWVDFTVKDTLYKEKSVYYLDSKGSSHYGYDWIFKVRDRYQAFIDKETYKPVWFYRQNYEGGYEVNNKYIFDYPGLRVFASLENSNRPFVRDTVIITDCTHDVLSLVYYTRGLNFSGMEVGDSIPVKSIIDGEVYNLYIRYLGRETIKTRKGETYNCIKFSALLVEGTMFKGGEDLFVWVTDDKNRVPVLVEAKILVGSVKAYLVETKGLKYPVTSIIKNK